MEKIRLTLEIIAYVVGIVSCLYISVNLFLQTKPRRKKRNDSDILMEQILEDFEEFKTGMFEANQKILSEVKKINKTK